MDASEAEAERLRKIEEDFQAAFRHGLKHGSEEDMVKLMKKFFDHNNKVMNEDVDGRVGGDQFAARRVKQLEDAKKVAPNLPFEHDWFIVSYSDTGMFEESSSDPFFAISVCEQDTGLVIGCNSSIGPPGFEDLAGAVYHAICFPMVKRMKRGRPRHLLFANRMRDHFPRLCQHFACMGITSVLETREEAEMVCAHWGTDADGLNHANDPACPRPPPLEPWERLKRKGNAAFSAGRHQEARGLYSEALELRPEDAVLLSNRSFAALKMGDAVAALVDAEAAAEADHRFGKAHMRCGAALEALGRLREAAEAYERGVGAEPGNSSFRAVRDALATRMAVEEGTRMAAEEEG